MNMQIDHIFYLYWKYVSIWIILLCVLASVWIFFFANSIGIKICRKFWTQWLTQSIGTLRVAAELVAEAKVMVRDRTKSGGSHPLVSLNMGYLNCRGKGLFFRLNLFTKSSKLPSLSMNKSSFKSLFRQLLSTPFQRQVPIYLVILERPVKVHSLSWILPFSYNNWRLYLIERAVWKS